MADNKYTSLADDQKASLREREALMRRKAMAGAPQAAPVPKPYAPPLTVDEITRKFMGGPAVQPTGIPQQSAQNPARPAPAAPAAAPAPQAEPMMRPDQSDRLSAQRARVSAGATQRDYKRAYDSGAGADELNRIGQNMDDYRRIDAGYQARQSGAPGPAFTPERVEAGRARLQEQAARIAAERNGQPLPGDTDTWSYEAGQRALPPELRGQKFTSPQDQANYRDFSRFAGGAPSIDPATGMMTTPADREYQNVQQMREQEQLARRKMSQPIEFAPFDPAEAQRNQAAATEHYNSILSRADAARGRVAGREGEYRTAAEGPTTTAAAATRAQLAEAERLQARSKSDTRMIPSQETAGIAENQAKATRANYDTINAGTMSLRDQAKANEERNRAEQMSRVAGPMADAGVAKANAETETLRTQAALAEEQRRAMLGEGGIYSKQMQAQRATAGNAADAEIQKASLNSPNPKWQRAMEIAHPDTLKADVQMLASGALTNDADRERAASALAARLSELETIWPTLDDVQRERITSLVRMAVPDTTDLSRRPLGEKAADIWSWTTPPGLLGKIGGLASGETVSSGAITSQYQRVQQLLNRLRSGAFGVGSPQR